MLLGVGSLVILILLTVTLAASRNFRTAIATRDTAADAERAVTQFVRELRIAATGVDGAYPITIAGDQEIIFHADIDSDGAAERVRYVLERPSDPTGGILTRTVTEAIGTPPRYDAATNVVTVIARGVRNDAAPMFTYLNAGYPADRTGNPLPAAGRLAATRLVRITLDVNADPPATPTTHIETTVTLRNIREY